MIEVFYSCRKCGQLNRGVNVRNREADEDVVRWFEGVVILGICDDHAEISPGCVPERLYDIKVPIEPGADGLGGVVRS